MKKIIIFTIIIFTFFILTSCSTSNLQEVVNSGNTSSWTIETLTSKVNIKQICETIKIWNNLSFTEDKFWKAILISESDYWKGRIMSSYYYGNLWWEMCMFVIEKWSIISKNYIN